MKLKDMNPDVLVLGSSGFKSYAQLGALWFLSYTPILRSVKTYVGCSIGSIISLLLICGYQPLEIINDDKILLSLLDYVKSVGPGNLGGLVLTNGLLSIDPIKNYLATKVKSKFGFIPTLSQLKVLRGSELVTVTVNITKGITEYLSCDNFPDLPCVEAVLMSVNFPMLFQRYTYQGDSYVDGSFGNPYPIDYMDDGNIQTLGIIVTDQPTESNDIVSYLYRVSRQPIEELRHRIIDNSSDKCYNLTIHVQTTNTSDMLLSGMEQAKRRYQTVPDPV